MSILTIDDIKRRSTRAPGDLCWHWQGAKATDGTPRIWTFDHDRCEKRAISGPKAIWNIAQQCGTRGLWAARVCVCTDCVNPAHIKLFTSKAELGAHIRLNGARKGKHTDTWTASLRKAWEASGVYPTPPEVVRQIRSETGTLREIGDRHGLSFKTVGRIRRGDSHKQVTA